MANDNITGNNQALNDNLKITSGINKTFSNINQDIINIEDILQNTYKTFMSLDASKWQASEKEEIDATFLPQLKEIVEKYPAFLRSALNSTQTAVSTHHQVDQQLQGNANDNLVDYSQPILVDTTNTDEII